MSINIVNKKVISAILLSSSVLLNACASGVTNEVNTETQQVIPSEAGTTTEGVITENSEESIVVTIESTAAGNTEESAEQTAEQSTEETDQGTTEELTVETAEETTEQLIEDTTEETSEENTEENTEESSETVTEPPVVEETSAELAELTPAQQQYELQKGEIQAKEAEVSVSSNIPCIYINTLSNVTPTSKNEYLGATIDIFNVDAAVAKTGAAVDIRVRGNSSAQTDKPPLKLRFAEPQNILGLHGGQGFTHWVILKTNWFMTADELAFKLGKTLLGENRYVADSQFIHLYVNGADWGICIACEQNEVDENRVNVKEAETEDTNPRDMGYFFEMDNYAGADDAPTFWIDNNTYAPTDITGWTRHFRAKGYTLKNDIISANQLQYISNYMNSLWQLIYHATYDNVAYVIDEAGNLQLATDITPEEAVRRVLDIDSAVNIYILEEIYHDFDRGAGSFFMAVDFSEGASYKKLTFLAPWDFGYTLWSDDATGLHTATYTTSGDINDTDNLWLIMLYYNEWFRQEVNSRYTELTNSGALKTVTALVDAELNSLATDAAMCGQSSRLSEAHSFIAYTNKRIDWLATQFCQ